MFKEMILFEFPPKYNLGSGGEGLAILWHVESAALNFISVNLFAVGVWATLGVGREILFWVLGGDWGLGFWRGLLLLFRRVGNFLRSGARFML